MQTPDAKQLAVVSLDDAGVCGTCGQVTAYGCPSCLVAHFCSRSCLQLAFRAHSEECGLPSQVEVDMPSQADAANPVNTRLLMHGCFSLKTTEAESAPRSFAVLPQHGLVPLEVPTDVCSPLVQVVPVNLTMRCRSHGPRSMMRGTASSQRRSSRNRTGRNRPAVAKAEQVKTEWKAAAVPKITLQLGL